MSYANPYTAAAPAGPPPLDMPYYGASPLVAFKRFFQKYATFSGRASRSEFWWWVLISILIGGLMRVPLVNYTKRAMETFTELLEAIAQGNAISQGRLDSMMEDLAPTGGEMIWSLISSVWSLAILIPSLALLWRRLHDAGHSGGWFFLGLVPLGGIVPFIMTLLGPKESGTRFDAVQPGGGNWNQPGGYGPPAGYGQAPGYAPPGYGQTSGYGQDPGYTPPGYGPGPSAPAAQPPLGPDGLPRYPQS